MTGRFKKPHPSEAVEAFLNHKLDMLPYPVMLDHDGMITNDQSKMAFELKSDSTYKDLLPLLMNEEHKIITSDFYLNAQESGNDAVAIKIDKLRCVPNPPEKYIAIQGLSKREEAEFLEEHRDFNAQVDKFRKLPNFFRILDMISKRKPLSLQHKRMLHDGVEILEEIQEVMSFLGNPSSLPDQFRSHEAKIALAEEWADTHGIGLSVKKKRDTYQEENFAQGLASGFNTASLLAPQINKLYADAKETVKTIVADRGKSKS